MTTRKKQSDLKVVHNSKPGRPPAIRAKVEALMRDVVGAHLLTCQIVPPAVPAATLRAFATETADSLWHELVAAGFRVIPSRLCQELALILGEAGEPTPAEDPALPKPTNPPTP